MSRYIERQNQQWPHRVAGLQQRPPVQEELPFDEKDEPLWKPPHGLPQDFDPFGDLDGKRKYAAHFRCRIAMPMPTTLQLSNEQPDYTGSHGMQVMQDHQGDWSFKQPKPNLAFTVPLEAAASTLQRKMGLEAPESYAIEHKGAPAVVSKWYPNSTQAFHKPPRLTDLSPEDHMTIQKNHALDWLIGNHDSHVGNWMRTEDGKLVSIDKGQAGKYFGHDRLDPQFHPNYYAREPIYNQLWRDHAQGRGQMHDPRTGELGAFVKQVQSIPDDELKGMFRPYAQAAAKSGLLLAPDGDPARELGPRTVPANDPEAFLHALVQRKNNLHNDLGEYYDRMSGRGRELVGAASELAKDEEWAYNPDGAAEELGVSPEKFNQYTKMKGAPEPTHMIDGVPHWNGMGMRQWDQFHQDYRNTPGRDGDWSRRPGTPGPYTEPGNTEPYAPRKEYDWMYATDPDGEYRRQQLEFEPWQNGELPRPVNGNQDPNFLENNGYLPYTSVPSPGNKVMWQSNGRARQWWKEDPESLADWQHQVDRQSPGQHALWGDDPNWPVVPVNSHLGARDADPGQAQGDRLYLPGDVADHLGVPRPTLMSWIYNNETPSPTHTSDPHEQMWDNLDVWEKWHSRRKSLEAGPRGYPDGWASEFQSHKEPERMLTIPDISKQTGMSLSDVYKSIYRPSSTKEKLPRNTHFAVGDDQRGIHLWESLRPMEDKKQQSRQAGISDQPDDVTDDYSLAEFLQWCARNRRDPSRNNLAQYAAVSGMDTENYLDIYLFLSTGS